MQPGKRKRRPRGEPALGDIDATKLIFETLTRDEAEERRKRTERLQALRLKAQQPDESYKNKRCASMPERELE